MYCGTPKRQASIGVGRPVLARENLPQAVGSKVVLPGRSPFGLSLPAGLCATFVLLCVLCVPQFGC